MGKLTDHQEKVLEEFLINQGLSFKPLRDEMFDHMSSDLAERMENGVAFQDAWQQCISEIPKNHFQLIQDDVMETINKGFRLSQWFSFSALALLLISTLFKVLHLQFASELLILSFIFIIGSLLATSVKGILLNKEKKGTIKLLGVVVSVVIMILGYGFKSLHLAGADYLVLLAVVLLIFSLVVNSIHVYQVASGEGNILTFLHEKYTPGIERFLLFLLIPLAVFQTICIALGQTNPAVNMVLLVVMFGSGLQFIAMSWRTMEQDLSRRNLFSLVLMLITCLCLSLPFLGQLLSFEVRIAIIVLFSIASAMLAYAMDTEKKLSSLVSTCLVPLIFLGWGLIRMGLIPLASHAVFFNIPVIVILAAALFLSGKHTAMRAYLMISLGSYLFEYII